MYAVAGSGLQSIRGRTSRREDRHTGKSSPNGLGVLFRTVVSTASLTFGLMLAGCSTTAPKPPEPAPAPVALQEFMEQAAKAHSEGARERARETYRTASKAYPSSKEPWLKLAENYFEATDYGNAILASQEVLLRDANDNVATSVLAVSGLRVSASALQTLRVQNRVAGDARSEAQTMAQTLRDVLGEAVLVPRPLVAAPAPAAPAKQRARARAPVAPASKAAAPAAAASSPSSRSPFEKLK